MPQAFYKTRRIILFESCTIPLWEDNYLCPKGEETQVLEDRAIWSRSHSGVETTGFLMSTLPVLSDFKRGRGGCNCLKSFINSTTNEHLVCSTGHQGTAYKIPRCLSTREPRLPTPHEPLPGPRTAAHSWWNIHLPPEWTGPANRTTPSSFVKIILEQYSRCITSKSALLFPNFHSDSIFTNYLFQSSNKNCFKTKQEQCKVYAGKSPSLFKIAKSV